MGPMLLTYNRPDWTKILKCEQYFRHIHAVESQFPVALSGSLNWIRRTLMSVGIMHLNALQLFSYSLIKTIISFFKMSCKHTDCQPVLRKQPTSYWQDEGAG